MSDRRTATPRSFSRNARPQLSSPAGCAAIPRGTRKLLPAALHFVPAQSHPVALARRDPGGCGPINLVENAIRRPAMNRRNALFAGHDEGGRNWARFASLIGTCKMNGVEPYAYLCDLFTRLANGHLAKDIDALMPWAYAARAKASQ